MKVLKLIAFALVSPILVLVDFGAVFTEPYPGQAFGGLLLPKMLSWALRKGGK